MELKIDMLKLIKTAHGGAGAKWIEQGIFLALFYICVRYGYATLFEKED